MRQNATLDVALTAQINIAPNDHMMHSHPELPKENRKIYKQ